MHSCSGLGRGPRISDTSNRCPPSVTSPEMVLENVFLFRRNMSEVLIPIFIIQVENLQAPRKLSRCRYALRKVSRRTSSASSRCRTMRNILSLSIPLYLWHSPANARPSPDRASESNCSSDGSGGCALKSARTLVLIGLSSCATTARPIICRRARRSVICCGLITYLPQRTPDPQVQVKSERGSCR
jgi:hypothetical protein